MLGYKKDRLEHYWLSDSANLKVLPTIDIVMDTPRVRKALDATFWDVQCTMRLSIELENFQVLKSKGLVFAQFWSKYDNSSADWWKTGQNLKEKYSHHIFVQNEAVICKKPVPGVS